MSPRPTTSSPLDAADARSDPRPWPAADQESPAGPIQILSIPGQPGPVRKPVDPVPAPAPLPEMTRPAALAASPAVKAALVEVPDGPPLAGSLGALAFGLFELQHAASADLRTFEHARATSGQGREDERRGAGPRADAFALLGEIDFLDF